MKAVFADTSYFLALLNPRDRDHAAAVAFSQVNDLPIVTTVWILTEVADALSRGPNRALFQRLLADLRRDDQSTVVWADQVTWDNAAKLFGERPDKERSLTDCSSFLVMQEYGLDQALTGDRHFEQAGFQALLKPNTAP